MKQDENNSFGSEDFSLNQFKNWIKNSEEISENTMIGREVVCKHSPKKVYSKIEVQEGDEEKVMKQFANKGGTIAEVNGDLYLLQIGKTGSLLIPKNLVVEND